MHRASVHHVFMLRALAAFSCAFVLCLVSCGGKPRVEPAGPGGLPPTSGGNGATSASGGGDDGASKSGDGAEKTAGAGDQSTPPEPIDGKLPASIEGTPNFSRHADCPVGGCNRKLLVPDALRAAIDDKSPIFMWEEAIPRKTALVLPRHVGVEVYGIVLEGEVSVMADDIKGKQKRCWKWNAFHAPGAGVQIFAKEPTRMLVALVATQGGTVKDAIDTLEKKAASVSWSKRSSPVTSVEIDARPELSWGGGAYHVRLGFEQTADDPQTASLGLLMMSKNAPVKEHTHDKEWEALAIISGDGELTRASGGNVKSAPGTFATIPPGVAHGFKPSGTAPLLAVQLYTPPGPEQRFKKLAEDGAASK